MRGIVVAAALVLAAAPAFAQRVTKIDGNKLLTLCSTSDVKNCYAYLDGIGDALAEEPQPRRACIPPSVTTQQLRDVLLKSLRNTPETRNLPAARLAVNAFGKAFPCHP
jgi:hypothetical protein